MKNLDKEKKIKMTKPVSAWYFSEMDRRLRYGDTRKISNGITHSVFLHRVKPVSDYYGHNYREVRYREVRYNTPIEACKHGLHASMDIFDALKYAPDLVVWKVRLFGKMDKKTDKIAAQHRTYLWGYNATKVFIQCCRRAALDVLPIAQKEFKIDPVIIEYLKTSNPKLRKRAVKTMNLFGHIGFYSTNNRIKNAMFAIEEAVYLSVTNYSPNRIKNCMCHVFNSLDDPRVLRSKSLVRKVYADRFNRALTKNRPQSCRK